MNIGTVVRTRDNNKKVTRVSLKKVIKPNIPKDLKSQEYLYHIQRMAAMQQTIVDHLLLCGSDGAVDSGP